MECFLHTALAKLNRKKQKLFRSERSGAYKRLMAVTMVMLLCFWNTVEAEEKEYPEIEFQEVAYKEVLILNIGGIAASRTQAGAISELNIQKNDIIQESELLITREIIPFDTEIIETDELEEGVEEVMQEGVPGEKEVTVKVIYTNGVERSQEILEEMITLNPVPKLMRRGTGKYLQINGNMIQYTRELVMNATAYTAGPESTGKSPGDPGYGITASGTAVRHGIVSVDPNVIPLGTSLYVEGYGMSVAADTGSAIVGQRIDLYYEDLQDAYQFGRRNIKVYVLK